MKVIKLKESDIQHIVKRVIKEDTHQCDTSKEYYNDINTIGDNNGKTKSWDEFWNNIIVNMKNVKEIDTTKEEICACLKQNVIYKSRSTGVGKMTIDKMCK